ncbi:DUF4383 domain-containing protein [Streptomyces sp. NPDC006879]|uniref:DUF4383 domain-containing protein n=1 Tax=Streptomyces sp. NPDC006879 TaxID=3364767 RepID=UPI00369003D8
MDLRDELPVDHRLNTVYRVGAALCGVILLVFGSLGFADQLPFFSTDGTRIAGLSSNGLLSLISVLVGLLLTGAAVVGGNTASTVNMSVAVVFLLSGFLHLFLIGKDLNPLDFSMSNVIFSFVVGLLLLTFGMYGRVSGGLPHDNPYWQRRHPQRHAMESTAPLRREAGALTSSDSTAP